MRVSRRIPRPIRMIIKAPSVAAIRTSRAIGHILNPTKKVDLSVTVVAQPGAPRVQMTAPDGAGFNPENV